MNRTAALLLFAGWLGPGLRPAAEADPRGVEFFEKRIRPVLVQHCYACHSADARTKKKLRGGLLLDTRDGLRKGGDSGPVLVPGKASDSLLYKSIRHDGELKMPPKQKLPAAVVADFDTWINRGAADPRIGGTVARVHGMSVEEGRTFWAYRPVVRPAIPAVKDRSWANGAIDAFILSALEAKGLRPARESDRATLARRLYYDLIGLPPSPEEVDAFVADSRPDAYERLVERLLGSPHFGERWGRHWLDVARFAESLTLRGFVLAPAWRYRDYVIDTFNDDVPFDRFVREQVAGDLLWASAGTPPPAPPRSGEGSQNPLLPLSASGRGLGGGVDSLRLPLPEAERGLGGGVDSLRLPLPEAERGLGGEVLPQADSLPLQRRGRIATAFLALGNTNLEDQDKKQLRMDVVDEQLDVIGRAFLAQTLGCARCHDHKFDPVPTRDYYALAGILRNTLTLTHANASMWQEVPLPVNSIREKALAAHESAVADLERRVQALRTALAKTGKLPHSTVRAVTDLPGIVVDDAQAKKVGLWTPSKSVAAYVGAGYIHDDNMGKGEKTITFQPKIPRTGKYEVRLAYSPATNRASRVPVTIFSADGEKTVFLDQRRAPEIDGLFVSLGRYTFERSSQGFVLVANEGTTGYVIADAVVFIPVESADAGKKSAPASAETGKLRRLEEQLRTLRHSGPQRETALSVREEKVSEDAHIHIRGSVHTLGDKVPRGFLQVATRGPMPVLPATASGRRELGDWLADARNPLTARVFVNRAWHWLFGEGLVRTPDNFGMVGDRPSHPELLDHLAAEFVANGWSVKQLVRTIVRSNTYRQSVTNNAQAREVDPDNRLLSHANRRRLDAECLRDTLLSISGRLTLDGGGPTWRAGLASDYGYKHTDTRRSVYAPVFRNALPELFDVFDFADPSVPTGRRNISTAAPQSLFLMNHPFILEQARHAARRLLAEPRRDEGSRITRAYRLTLGRPPMVGERRLAEAFLAGTKPERREEAWAQLFQVLFASVDFRYVE